MNNYLILAENDESQWDDETGAKYHFPIKYKNLVLPGTKFIYYKGGLRNKEFADKRLLDSQHYFGMGEIGTVYEDTEHPKRLFAEVVNYEQFSHGVFWKNNDNEHFEEVSRSNHFRDGVRTIPKDRFQKIIDAAGVVEVTLPTTTAIHISEGELLIPLPKDIKVKKETGTHFPQPSKENGDLGEKIVFDFLKSSLGQQEQSTLKWHALEGETPGYDISYINEKKEKICIEVKSTVAKKFPYLNITINELNTSIQEPFYYLYLVSDIKSLNPKIEKIRGPFLEDEFLIEPIAFKIYRKEI
ncbi:protein NO VEIN domain-containing protein [Desertivirga arenae]|uniref:protein NO VEIN domain-containing protein n=1 Tax=Desertivirga arenae TaxID=2810309 RepID=UPI001A978F95|nr:DUF3883 domain-containing protein [Pedobacter sp. SYSU D00823]